MNIFKYNKGYTLLFSIIVSSVVLSIAAFILSVSRKQFILSSVVRDSTIAIYAADGGMQCAVQAYYEGFLATSTSGVAQKVKIDCNGKYVIDEAGYNVLSSPPSDPSMNLKYDANHKVYQSNPITLIMPSNTCAKIQVTWGYDSATDGLKAVIDSRGYNFGNYYPCGSNTTINPRAIERGIRMQYNQ